MAQKFVVQPPPQFHFSHRQSRHAWRSWKQRFEIYLGASDYDTAPDRKETSLFLNAIGPDGIEFFNTFTLTEEEKVEDVPKFTAVLKKFDDHFQSSVNVTFERHLFFVRDQAQGETTDRYVTALRTLAATCEFGELKESLIRDSLVCELCNGVVKERLLRTSGLKLQTALDTCRAAEQAKEQVKAIESPPEEKIVAVRLQDAMGHVYHLTVIKPTARQRPALRNHHLLVNAPVVVTSMGLSAAQRSANPVIFAKEWAILRPCVLRNRKPMCRRCIQFLVYKRLKKEKLFLA
jgi:hypothetical protein